MAPSVDLTPVAFTRLRRAPCRWSIQSRVSSPRLLDAYETKDGTPVPATDDGEAGDQASSTQTSRRPNAHEGAGNRVRSETACAR